MTSRLQRVLRDRHGDEAGFTLVEVLVALVVFAMVSSAAIGMFIAATRASLIAKMDTGAKNLSQERLEQLRNLPFHIDHNTGATAEQDDLLDTYFTAYSASNATCLTRGFVHGGTATSSTAPAAGSVRCTYYGDPATGDFYRYDIPTVPGYSKYSQYVTVQFLGSNGAGGAALDVPSTYNTQGDPTTADIPVSGFVGARVTTLWTVGKTSKRNSVFTLISQGRPAPTTVSFNSQATAMTVTGRLTSSATFTSQAGVVNVDGAATRNTIASTSAQGVYAAVDPGDRINGSCAIASSAGTTSACTSPSATGLSVKDAANNLLGTFGPSSASGVAISTSSSLPQVGTADATGNPTGLVIGSIDSSGSAPDIGGQTIYGASTVVPVAGYVGDPALMLNTGKPLVYIDKPANASVTVCGNASAPTIAGTSIPSSAAFSAGYGTTVGGVSHFASTCVASQVLGTHLFPTSFAQQGILLLDFTSQVTCRTNGGLYDAAANPNGGKGLAGYSGTVRVWNSSTSSWGSAISFSPSAPLDTVLPLTTVVAPGLTLGNYIGSWSSNTPAQMTSGVIVDQDNNAVNLNYDAMARMTSTLLAPADPNSTFGLLLGGASCRVEDNR